MEKRGTIEMLAAMVICGTIGITVHLSNQNTVSLLFFRCLLGAMALFVICFMRGYFNKQIVNLKTVTYALLGGGALLINWYFLFTAYKSTSIGIATTVYNTQPLMMMVFGFFFFKEKITLNDLLWMAISLLGLLFVSNIAWQWSSHQTSGTFRIIGLGEALIAALFYAFASIFAKMLKGTPPTLIALLQMSLGVLCLAPYANVTSFLHPNHITNTVATFLLGILHTGIMYVLLYSALQKIALHRAAALSFVYPIIALLIDAGILHIRISLGQWIGVTLILLGVAGITLKWTLWPRLKKAHSSDIM